MREGLKDFFEWNQQWIQDLKGAPTLSEGATIPTQVKIIEFSSLNHMCTGGAPGWIGQ